MEKLNFWDNTHPLSAESERLYAALVPAMDFCETMQGELLRASSKIGYDWYNNGWGCNNWSGAVVYLEKYFTKLPNKPDSDAMVAFGKALGFAYDYSHGERVPRNSEKFDAQVEEAVTLIHAAVVQAILDNPEPIRNPQDMWTLKERDADYHDDEDEYGHGWDEEE